MQTFLPYPDISLSLRCLDWRRLGKQRVEAQQILNTLEGKSSGWARHPAVRMWTGCENLLAAYLSAAIIEWTRRGYRNTMSVAPPLNVSFPSWWGGPIHSSHRSSLLRKDPEHYSQFGWTDDPNQSYFWPEVG